MEIAEPWLRRGGRMVRRVVVLGVVATQIRPVPASARAAHWTIVPTHAQPGFAFFGDIEASGPTSVWAFGISVQRWTGTAWQVVSPSADRFLRSAVVRSPTDIWAVGHAPLGPGSHGVIERWDGRSLHVVLRVKRGGSLGGIAQVLGTQHFWAVGYHVKAGRISPVIRHRGQRGWRPVANPVSSGDLHAVASSGLMTWAVGQSRGSVSHRSALAERWTGRHWVITPVPQSGDVSLQAVAAVSRAHAAHGRSDTARYAATQHGRVSMVTRSVAQRPHRPWAATCPTRRRHRYQTRIRVGGRGPRPNHPDRALGPRPNLATRPLTQPAGHRLLLVGAPRNHPSPAHTGSNPVAIGDTDDCSNNTTSERYR